MAISFKSAVKNVTKANKWLSAKGSMFVLIELLKEDGSVMYALKSERTPDDLHREPVKTIQEALLSTGRKH